MASRETMLLRPQKRTFTAIDRLSAAAVAASEGTQPLNFASRTTSFQEARALVRQVEDARSTLALYRSSEPRASSVDFAQRLVASLNRLPARGSER